jgi:superfamily I DNA/RNA helicase
VKKTASRHHWRRLRKTSTLAHRVAHLIISGADPRRVLLMTFSRRAAAEMTRRAERILRSATGSGAAGTADRLSWAGTFHAIGARLLRTYANEIGLDPAFTIHDREDSADLLNLARHRLGFSKTPTRFPLKGTCLAIYSRCVNGEVPIEEVLRTSFPWCGEWADALKKLFAAYVEAAGDQCNPRIGAQRGIGVSLREAHSLGGEPVKRWSSVIGLARAVEVGITAIVDDDEQDVRPACWHRRSSENSGLVGWGGAPTRESLLRAP